jgi:hypothetical protein
MYQPKGKLLPASSYTQVGSNKCKYTNWSFPIKLLRLGYKCDIVKVIKAMYQPNDKLPSASPHIQDGSNKCKFTNWSFPIKL